MEGSPGRYRAQLGDVQTGADGRADAASRSDQLDHFKVSMTQDRYLGRKLTDRQTADVLEKLMQSGEK